MILYLTYNDAPSGVYWSQVTDVVAHLNTLGMARVRLVALVSPRGFWAARTAIRKRLPDAIVLPMVPKARNWRHNRHWLAALCRTLRPTGIMARGVFATWMALRMRERGLLSKVCFDGRGAYAAEWEEYRLVDDDRLIAEFRPTERKAVLEADVRLAVSEALVEHWRERYGYTGQAHVVVPCTLGQDLLRPVEVDVLSVRREMGWGPNDRVLVYSGSTAGWQSFALLEELLAPMLSADPECRVLFLSRNDPHADELARRFPGQVAQRWLSQDAVRGVLAACDAGLLVREDTITNRVASPTKFAEYLSAGLPVLISAGLGDFTEMVEQEELGWVFRPGHAAPQPQVLGPLDRQRLVHFAERHFSKAAYEAAYRKILTSLAG